MKGVNVHVSSYFESRLMSANRWKVLSRAHSLLVPTVCCETSEIFSAHY